MQLRLAVGGSTGSTAPLAHVRDTCLSSGRGGARQQRKVSKGCIAGSMGVSNVR